MARHFDRGAVGRGPQDSPGGDAAFKEWISIWASLTVAAAAISTVVDAVLMQLSIGYFTGGFLAVDHISGLAEALAFLGGSLLSDAAIGGVIVAVTLWLARHSHIPTQWAALVALAFALVPLITADFVSYRLAEYFGDVLNLRVLFDLAGRSIEELLAVSFEHLTIWIVGSITALAAISGIWLLQRRLRRATIVAEMPLSKALLASLVFFLIGATAVAALRLYDDTLDSGLKRKPSGRVIGELVDALSDFDRDGYGLLARPSDPDNFNASIQPYAIDIPGDGVDQDGVDGDLPCSTAPYTEFEGAGEFQSKPDIVLVVLESVRADAIGTTLNGKPITPIFDQLARGGVVVPLAYSHNGFTVQSRQHIFSGSVAGIRGKKTLIDDFNEAGYQTGYFSAQDESFGGGVEAVGMDRADVTYDARVEPALRYTKFSSPGSIGIPHTVLSQRLDTFLSSRDPSMPLFLYVNFQDTHYPYHHSGVVPLVSGTALEQSEITPEHSAALREMYLNTLSNVDRAVGQLLDRMRKTTGREPGVVVISDHGESLFDEGFLGHGYALNDAQTRVPLIVSNLPARIVEPFGQADLREMLGNALRTPRDANAQPEVVEDRARNVFQYMGSIEQPAQIGLRGIDTQVVYDFRNAKTRINGGRWLGPDDLAATERSRLSELVRLWERMMLARVDEHRRRGSESHHLCAQTTVPPTLKSG